MIFGFVGTPGSGKSYDAVRKVLDNLKSGKVVYTNIDGLEDDFCQEFIKLYTGLDDCQFAHQLRYKTNAEMQCFWEFVENESLIVIDEVHKLFSNRNWQSSANNIFADWASTHRHIGCDLVLITQDLEKVEKHVRSLIEWTYYYRKVNFFGSMISNKYLRYAYSGDDHNGQPLSKQTCSYQKKVFQCYKSYASADIKEQGIMQTVNVLRHPVFYAIPVVLLGVIWMGSKSSLATGDIFGANKAMATAAASAKKVGKHGAVSTLDPSKQAVQPKDGTSGEQTCFSYKVLLPDGVIALVPEIPAGAQVLKCFGSKKRDFSRLEG
jgi:zona occludens toxin (predicted ATPase)